ncbi:MAG TPA: Wzz/FepE/Etk N-terminal domain-containing protein [Holophagaceae bacterium]|nr:Wzz/FepE/Etk N-terminal domain-containing protein [Holophagaceae bacterium]
MPQASASPLAPILTALRGRWPAWKAPLRAGFLAALVAAVFVLFLPNRYTSTARILPGESPGNGLGALSALAGAAGLSLPGADSSDAAYVDILNSRSLREALLQTRFRFHQRSWRFGAEQAKDETLQAYLDQPNLDGAVAALGEHVTVTRDLKTRLLTVAVETKSPELSQAAVQRLVALLNDFVTAKARTRGSEKAAFAEARLKDARAELDRAQAAFQRFLEANRNYALSADPTVKLEGARLEMEYRLQQQLVGVLAQNREQALLEAKNDLPILNVLDPGNLPIDKSGPARTPIVLFFLLFVTVGTYLLQAWTVPGASRR